MVTMAKPLANGYPVGAVLIKDTVAETMTAGERKHRLRYCAEVLIDNL